MNDLKLLVEQQGYAVLPPIDTLPAVDPAIILEQMLAARLHLDHCGPENGPLRVLPGTHRHGRIAETSIPGWRSRVPEVVCTVPKGPPHPIGAG